MSTPRASGRPRPDRAAKARRPLAWAEGRVLPAHQATVPLLDDGFLRGDAVFDAMLVRRGRTHARDAHLARLRRSGQAMGIRVPVVSRLIADLLAAWGEHDGALKIVVTRGGTLRGLIYPADAPESMSLATVDAPWRSNLTGVKTLSYAANQAAGREAREAHADDALIVSGDRLLELPSGSLCLVRDEQVFTPDPEQVPILRSVTVQQLAQVTAVTPAVLTLEDLATCDELFVVSATRPVVAVRAVATPDGEIERPAPGPATRELQRALDAHIEATLD